MSQDQYFYTEMSEAVRRYLKDILEINFSNNPARHTLYIHLVSAVADADEYELLQLQDLQERAEVDCAIISRSMPGISQAKNSSIDELLVLWPKETPFTVRMKRFKLRSLPILEVPNSCILIDGQTLRSFVPWVEWHVDGVDPRMVPRITAKYSGRAVVNCPPAWYAGGSFGTEASGRLDALVKNYLEQACRLIQEVDCPPLRVVSEDCWELTGSVDQGYPTIHHPADEGFVCFEDEIDWTVVMREDDMWPAWNRIKEAVEKAERLYWWALE